MTLQTTSTLRAGAMRTLRPPPKLTLSQWADEHFRLSAENAAVPGRWTSMPFQVEILDAITDPTVSQVSVMKSARVGYTSCLTAAMGFHMVHDPCGILVVRPDQDACRAFVKEVVSPMCRDVPAVSKMLDESPINENDNTLEHIRYPGGVLSFVGAHSGAGFRSISRRVVLFDEPDAYPPSAGSDGDQIALGMKRSETFWNRKTVAGSTPLVQGVSRIERLFNEGDRRRYHVPCPHCGHFDFLVFSPRSDARGHVMVFIAPKKGAPKVAEDVHFVCARCHGRIEHTQKRDMVAKGKWIAEGPFVGHASFHIWSAYSYSPGAAWQNIADDFLKAQDDRGKLRTFINTTLGETMAEAGDAPDWEPLYNRRERYTIGTVPEGVKFLTAGIDTQKDRLVYEIVGWGAARESWSIDMGVLLGPTAEADVWRQLDELLDRKYGELPIRMAAIDAAAFSQTVYAWVRRKSGARVMASRGVAGARALVGVPTAVDVNYGGKTIKGGVRLWPLGVDGAKSELYGWLHLPQPGAGEHYPSGWLHFPEYSEEYFRQLTAERLVIEDKKGAKTMSWTPIQGRENHLLDCRNYARAAAARCGVDRLKGETTRAPVDLRPLDAAAPAPSLDKLMSGGSEALVRETAAVIWGPKAAPGAAKDAPVVAHQPPTKAPAPRRKSWLPPRGGGRSGWL
jgi:phage terminase large subunit GpA-like protein